MRKVVYKKAQVKSKVEKKKKEEKSRWLDTLESPESSDE